MNGEDKWERVVGITYVRDRDSFRSITKILEQILDQNRALSDIAV